jgi:hypothetical protein
MVKLHAVKPKSSAAALIFQGTKLFCLIMAATNVETSRIKKLSTQKNCIFLN